MKKYYFYGDLLISTSCTPITSPPLEQTKHTQAAIPAAQTTPDKKYKRNIAALSSLFWLLNNHRPDRKIIRVEDWRK